MKTIILRPPHFRALIIAVLIFSSMAFRNPFITQSGSKGAQLTDTIPDTDIHANVDVNKIIAEVNKAIASINIDKITHDIQQSLQKIDFEKMQTQIQQSLQQINFEKMQKDIEASLKNTDWKKMNRNMDSCLKKMDFKKMKIDIEKNADQLRKQLNSKEFQQSMQKLKDVDMNKIREQMNKAKIEIEKNQEQLKKQLQKLKEELEAKDAAMANYPYAFEKNGFIWI